MSRRSVLKHTDGAGVVKTGVAVVAWWLEGNEKGRYQVAECRRAVQRRHAHQPNSWIGLGGSWVMIMWDTGCS